MHPKCASSSSRTLTPTDLQRLRAVHPLPSRQFVERPCGKLENRQPWICSSPPSTPTCRVLDPAGRACRRVRLTVAQTDVGEAVAPCCVTLPRRDGSYSRADFSHGHINVARVVL